MAYRWGPDPSAVAVTVKEGKSAGASKNWSAGERKVERTRVGSTVRGNGVGGKVEGVGRLSLEVDVVDEPVSRLALTLVSADDSRVDHGNRERALRGEVGSRGDGDVGLGSDVGDGQGRAVRGGRVGRVELNRQDGAGAERVEQVGDDVGLCRRRKRG